MFKALAIAFHGRHAMRATELYFIVCLERDHSRRRATIIKIIRDRERYLSLGLYMTAAERCLSRGLYATEGYFNIYEFVCYKLQQGVKWSALITFYRMHAATADHQTIIIKRRQINHCIARPRQPTRQPARTQNNQTALTLAVPQLSVPALGLRLTAVTP